MPPLFYFSVFVFVFDFVLPKLPTIEPLLNLISNWRYSAFKITNPARSVSLSLPDRNIVSGGRKIKI